MESPSSLQSRYRAVRQHDSVPEVKASFADSAPVRQELQRHSRRKSFRSTFAKLGKAKKWIFVAVAAVALVLVGSMMWHLFNPGIAGVDKSKYQAIFLVDGTQYVGKLNNLDSGHYKLTNAYFVTANSTPVVSDQGSKQNSSNQVALVKLETGLLNAENEMMVPKDKVLFYENLKSDGQAAKLLDNSK